MRSKVGRGVVGALVGATPGILLVLLAQFVISGELQLTVGAPGIMIAVLGLVVGFGVGFRSGRSPSK
jgi:hypothetical protein